MKLFHIFYKKEISTIVLVTFVLSILSPINNLYAGVPDVILSYSKNPTNAGIMTVTATYSEPVM
jgi:hypothetical protein